MAVYPWEIPAEILQRFPRFRERVGGRRKEGEEKGGGGSGRGILHRRIF